MTKNKNDDNINTGKHYGRIIINEQLVGQKLDPALIATLYNLDPLLLQALKKLLLSGKRGIKDRQDDLIGVIAAVNRQLELDSLGLSGYERTNN